MSGWPWIKGQPSAIADAEPDETDPRPIVKEVIQTHRDAVDQLQAELLDDPLYDPQKHDDLWCVRFLLSHKGNMERALQAAKTTLQFRKKHNLDAADLRETPPQDYKSIPLPAFNRFMTSGVGSNSLIYAKEERTVVAYINIGSMDPHQLAELDTDDWVTALAFANEWNYQWLDFITRTTGRLTKSVRFVDVGTVRLSQVDMGCQEKYTTAIGGMQDCYPQAIQSIYVCFAPFWIQTPWRLIRPFLPERVVSKMDFLSPVDNEDDLQRLLQHVPRNHLPARFGGTLEDWPPGSASSPDNEEPGIAKMHEDAPEQPRN